MTRVLLSFLASLVFASQASAQSYNPSAPTYPTTSGPLYAELVEPTSSPFSERAHFEIAGGLLAGGLAVGLGYVAAEEDMPATSLLLWTAGQLTAIPAGVTLGGSIGDGDGGYGHALMGSAAGTGLGALLWYGIAQSVEGEAVLPLGHLILGAFALGGSLLGYELSTSPSRPDDEPVDYVGVRVEPMIAAVPNVETLSLDALTVGVQGTM